MKQMYLVIRSKHTHRGNRGAAVLIQKATQAGPRAGLHLNCMYNYMQHRVQKQLLLSILVLPWCDEAIYLRCMSKKQTYAKKYSVPHRHHVHPPSYASLWCVVALAHRYYRLEPKSSG